MIVSKPKTNTLLSLGVFLAIAFSLVGVTLQWAVKGGEMVWYHYLVLGIFGPVGLAVLAKTALGYKVVSIGKGMAEVHYPIRFARKRYDFKNLAYWKEITIKTASGPFNQLEICFEGEKYVKLGKQENTAYLEVANYMRKKHPKKKAKD